MRSLLSFMGWLHKVLFKFLIEIVVFPGSNLLGMVFFVAFCFGWVEASNLFEGKVGDELLQIAGGLVCFGIDVGVRKALGHETLFEYYRGARFVFLPLWMWGAIWMVGGIVRLLGVLLV